MRGSNLRPVAQQCIAQPPPNNNKNTVKLSDKYPNIFTNCHEDLLAGIQLLTAMYVCMSKGEHASINYSSV